MSFYVDGDYALFSPLYGGTTRSSIQKPRLLVKISGFCVFGLFADPWRRKKPHKKDKRAELDLYFQVYTSMPIYRTDPGARSFSLRVRAQRTVFVCFVTFVSCLARVRCGSETPAPSTDFGRQIFRF